MFTFIYNFTQDTKLALSISALTIAGCSAIDCIAYASIFPINMALLSSEISFILYLEAYNNIGKKKCVLFVMSGIGLFAAFCMYQIATTIVFVMYVIYETYRKREKEKKHFIQAFCYMLYYAVVTVSYLVSTKIFQIICEVKGGQSERSHIVFTLEKIMTKINWFVMDVCPQTLKRIIGLAFGNFLFFQKNMFYNCSFRYLGLGIFISLLLIALILLSIIWNTIQKRSGVYILIALSAIPLSIWPFLILPENYYLTYYAIGIILLFLWYICDGIVIVGKFCSKNIKNCKCLKQITKIVVFGIICVVGLQSNIYAEAAWVNYCRDSYEYIANTIAAEIKTNSEIKTILVQGNIGPYVGGREYVIFCVKDALKEMERDPNYYNIIQYDCEYYISTINDNEIQQMEQILGKKRLEQLLQFYIHNDLYGIWNYNGTATDEKDLKFLQECFINTGQILKKNDDNILINLDGFNLRNNF